MKRIPRTIAVESVLGYVRGDQRIRVIDYPASYTQRMDTTDNWSGGEIIFDGPAMEISSVVRATMRQYMAYCSECRGIKPWIDPDTGEIVLLFQICTAYE